MSSSPLHRQAAFVLVHGSWHGAWCWARVPQPFAVYQQPLHFDAARVAALPRTFIDCTSPALPTIAASRVRVRQEPGWQLHELKTGHDPRVSEPQALADLLLGVHRQAD